MNKLSKIGFILIFSLFVAACGGNDNPQQVAKSFFKALSEQDYEKAGEFGTESTKAMLTLVKSFAEMADKDAENEMGDLSAIEWGETEIDGDKAVCHYSVPGKEDQKVDLKKVDGEWKVDMKKDM